MIINQFRTYLKDKTVSQLFSNSVCIGTTLEDVGRPAGVKIQAETCIPEGVYKVAISHSPRFDKNMMVLYNITNDHSVERDGVRFTGVRVHRGSNIQHTEGCILHKNYEELQKDVQASLDKGEDVYWVICEGID